MSNRKWIVLSPDKEKSEELSRILNISPVTSQVLINRGIKDISGAKKFLYGDFSSLTPPLEIPNVEKAVNLIKEKIKRGEKILIYGDFDIDGIAGTALLFLTLKKIGADVNYYIPRRKKGHGLDKNSIMYAKEQGFSLIVTVDCGSSDVEEIEYAKEIGIDLVVTDHHLPEKRILKDSIIINPKFEEKITPYYESSGCAVSYMLARALIGEEAKEYLDIVTLGTVGDVVPLLEENRILVKEGLKLLKNSSKPGIDALLEITNLKNVEINADFHLPYILIPRINSAGRMWEPQYAVELFLTENREVAERIVKILDEKNRERQLLQEKILKEAIEIIEKLNLLKNKIIIVKGKSWHTGVIGIVASKIVESFNRPAILINEEEYAKGSCRSIEEFHIFEALKAQEELLLKYGGHRLAAGFVTERKNIEKLVEKLQRFAEEKIKDEDIIPKIFIDREVNFKELNKELAREIQLFAPFGCGNPQPLFLSRNVRILELSTAGGQEHLKFKLQQDGEIIEGVWWGEGNKIHEIGRFSHIDILFYPQINIFKDEEKLQLNIKDLRKAEV